MEQQNLLTAALAFFIGNFGPAILARLGIHINGITPPKVPQSPTVDAQLDECLKLLDQYNTQAVKPDDYDWDAMRKIKAKIEALLASQPAK